MIGIYKGINVLDFTTNIWGSFTSLLLAESGAEVVKIEPPEGDPMRGRGYRKNDVSLTFQSLNLNKKSICIDYRKPEGAELIKKLVPGYDIVIEDSMPGQMDRYGLSYDDCRELNPGLIYLSVTGYGQNGPNSRRHPVDANIIVEGLMAANYPKVEREIHPVVRGGDLASYVGGVYGLCAVAMAIYHRDCTGLGQYLDVNMLTGICSAALQMGTLLGQANHMFGVLAEENTTVGYSPVGVIRTRDGFIDFNASTEAGFAALKELMPYDEVLFDEKYNDPKARAVDFHLLMGRIEQWSMTLSSYEVDRLFEKAKIPVGMITMKASDLLANEHLQATDRFVNVDVPGVGSLPFTRYPINLSGFREEGFEYRAAPEKGADTRAVLMHEMYTEAEIELLQKDGIICF